jgi:glycosyltransferase involved in cell wall biosynthesis
MPSKKEPWGVVLHEMAIAGLPLLASENVGAASAFLREGENGKVFKLEELSNILPQFLDNLTQIGADFCQKSRVLGTQHDSTLWLETLTGHLIN